MKRFPRPLNPFSGEWNRKTADELGEFLRSIWWAVAGSQGTPSTPSQIQAGTPSSAGTAQAPAPSDHVHQIATATPSTKVGLNGEAREGNSSSVLRSDARLVLEDGTSVGDAPVWNGTEWVSQDPISIERRSTAIENSDEILTELKTISSLLKNGLNVPDEVEDIRNSFSQENDIMAELKTIHPCARL